MAQDDDYHPMDEIIPNLWIGDLAAAKDEKTLRANNIHSVLSAMRGKVKVHETFTHFQIQLDDMEDADALAFFPQCIAFIEDELEKGRGVLVHCQAGMSRSATIVAAYLMYAKQIDAQAALDLITKARPSTQPNNGFLTQLDVFHQGSYKVSRRNKAMRMYYLERALEEVINGDGTIPEDNMFAKFPRSPSDSAPATPGGPRRRIRCKMCRQELAAREHMLDHGQVGPSTPATIGAFSPAASRRPSSNAHDAIRPLGLTPLQSLSRRPSAGAGTQERPLATLNGEPVSSSMQLRRLSSSGSRSGDMLALTPLGPPSRRASTSSMAAQSRPRRSSLAKELLSGNGSATRIIPEGVAIDDSSALDDDEEEEDDVGSKEKEVTENGKADGTDEGKASGANGSTTAELNGMMRIRTSAPLPPPAVSRSSSSFMSPMDLAAQLNANPKLAALRSTSSIGGIGGLQPMTPMSPLTPSTSSGNPIAKQAAVAAAAQAAAKSPPLLINNSCSGYFVEPMSWMESFLEDGQMAGKIVCPNKKCGAKLGNYDWAGVCCSCKEWVTPGFCIHRSKVDEIV